MSVKGKPRGNNNTIGGPTSKKRHPHCAHRKWLASCCFLFSSNQQGRIRAVKGFPILLRHHKGAHFPARTACRAKLGPGQQNREAALDSPGSALVSTKPTWSLHDPQQMGSLPKIKASWTHLFRVMKTLGRSCSPDENQKKNENHNIWFCSVGTALIEKRRVFISGPAGRAFPARPSCGRWPRVCCAACETWPSLWT